MQLLALVVPAQDRRLHRRSVRHGLVGIDALARLLSAKKLGEQLLHARDARGTTHEHHFVDGTLRHLRIAQALLDRLHGRVLRMREAIVGVDATERSVSIALSQILPNIISPLIVTSTVRLGFVILIVAALSFLGLGTPPPTEIPLHAAETLASSGLSESTRASIDTMLSLACKNK